MIKSGFFDSFQGDRKYNAEDVGSLLDGIISDGILNKYGDHFACTFSGMNVTVGSGRGWFKNTWIYNDDNYVVTCEQNATGKERIDTVVIDINKEDEVRANSIQVVKGTTVHPTLLDGASHAQYPLYDVVISAAGNVIDRIIDRRSETYAQLNIANTVDEGRTIVPFWPIGSIYMSVSNIEPSTLFGGTWEPIRGRFLIGCGSEVSIAPGEQGGSWAHNITVDHLPAHHHHIDFLSQYTIADIFLRRYDGERVTVMSWAAATDGLDETANKNYLPAAWNYRYSLRGSSSPDEEQMIPEPSKYYTSNVAADQTPHGHQITGDTQNTGASNALDVHPPYLGVYMWKRIS